VNIEAVNTACGKNV